MMAESLNLSDVVIDLDIYPRSQPSDDTISRYAEALSEGAEFPAIILESGTNRLLDGLHRYRAHEQTGVQEIAASHWDVPEGIPAKVFAASFSTRHGDQISKAQLKVVTREAAEANPDLDQPSVARLFGVSQTTVSRWCSDIRQHRVLVCTARAKMLTDNTHGPGLSTRDTAALIGVKSDSTVRDYMRANISAQLTDDLVAEALSGIPDEYRAKCQAVADEWMKPPSCKAGPYTYESGPITEANAYIKRRNPGPYEDVEARDVVEKNLREILAHIESTKVEETS